MKAARVALEEHDVQLFLQRADLAADGGLRKAQRVAGMGETASRGHRVENA